MTKIPPTSRRDPPNDPWDHERHGDGDGRPARGRSRLLVFLALAIALTGLVLWLDGRYPNTLESEDSLLGVARLGAILVLVASGILASRRLNLGKAVRDIAIWAAVLAGLVAVYGFRAELGMVGDRIMGELEPHRAIEMDGGELVFRRGPDGHFYISAVANGQPVMFLVDTGASEIVLSPQDAERLRIDLSALNYNRRYQTANGTVMGASVRLDTLSVGPIRMRNVEVSINGADMSESLLGMTFLDRLSSYEVRGDTLILRP